MIELWPNAVRVLEAVPPATNRAPLSIAPTGTLSIIAGTSRGIEPLFAPAYRRAHTLGGGLPGRGQPGGPFVTATEVPVDQHVRIQAAGVEGR